MSSSIRARRLATLVVVPVVLLLAWALPASAHPYLLSSDPSSGTLQSKAPTTLLLSFTEQLNRDYSRVTLVAPDDTDLRTSLRGGGPASTLLVVPDRPLRQQGTYAVEWTAVGADGHTVTGTFPFSVGHVSINPAVRSVVSSGDADSALGALPRALHAILPLLLVLLVGVLLLEPRLVGAAPRWTPRIRTGMGLASLATASALLTQPSSTRVLLEVGALLVLLLGRRSRPLSLAAGGALLLLTAASGHVQSQAGDLRLGVLALYVVHLTAISTWLGAIVAAVLGVRERLLRLVSTSLAVAVITGTLLTSWALRAVSQLTSTRYGELVLLKAGLLVVAVALGLLASRRGRRLEALVALGIVVAAGVLGQASLPIDLPRASQVYAEGTGLPVSVAAFGDGLVTGVVTPGIVGPNTLLVRVTRTDSQDFQQDVHDVRAISADVECTCSSARRSVTLTQVAGSPWWSAPVSLPVAGRWSITARPALARAVPRAVVLAAAVLPDRLPGQVVIGVPADLSGPQAQQCDDQVLGLQAALAGVNAQGSDHLLRVVTADVHNGTAAALATLRGLGATSLATPCGTPSRLADIQSQANGLPTIGQSGQFSVATSWAAEGAALAAQARTQGARSVTIVVGTSAADLAVAAALRSGLAGLPLTTLPTTTSADRFVHGVDLLVLVADPSEALPLTQQLSVLNQRHWAPTHGLLASRQLMDPDFINAAGWLTRTGTIEFASDVNPFDPTAQYYAQRLRELTPGERPTFQGLHGFQTGLLLASALRQAGGDPAPARLRSVLASRFGSTTIGSSQVHWTAAGGSASALAFFRSTYVSPMAASPLTPGGATSLNHEGTFLNAGGFEQISPFRKLT